MKDGAPMASIMDKQAISGENICNFFVQSYYSYSDDLFAMEEVDGKLVSANAMVGYFVYPETLAYLCTSIQIYSNLYPISIIIKTITWF